MVWVSLASAPVESTLAANGVMETQMGLQPGQGGSLTADGDRCKTIGSDAGVLGLGDDGEEARDPMGTRILRCGGHGVGHEVRGEWRSGGADESAFQTRLQGPVELLDGRNSAWFRRQSVGLPNSNILGME